MSARIGRVSISVSKSVSATFFYRRGSYFRMPELEIDLPGAPSIRFEGQELDTDRRKAIAFLANLVVIGEEDS